MDKVYEFACGRANICIRVWPDGKGELIEGFVKPNDDDPFADEDVNDIKEKAALDALESVMLAHACAGINIEDKAYVKGIETALDAIGNNAF